MSNQESEFFNQNILSFKDLKYSTNGYIKCSLFTSTIDYKNFNQLFFSISISNDNFSNNCSLNVFEATNLLSSLQNVFENSNKIGKEKFQVIRKIKDKILNFTFLEDENNPEYITHISIFLSETSSNSIIVPITFVKILAMRLKSFIQNYEQSFLSMIQSQLLSKLLDVNNRISRNIEILPSQVSITRENNFQKEAQNVLRIERENNPEDNKENILDNFNSFIEKNLDSIEIEEISKLNVKSAQPTFSQKVKSILIDNILSNDISNLIQLTKSCLSTNNPIYSFMNTCLKMSPGNNTEDFFRGASEEERKSIFYLSKLLYSIILNSYLSCNNPIPNTIPLLRYRLKNNELTDFNKNLSMDLLISSIYIRIAKEKLEQKITDENENFSLDLLGVRTVTDSLIYSIIKFFNKDQGVNILLNKFRSYKELGFFKSIEEKLEMYNKNISENEMRQFFERVFDHLETNNDYIKDIHDEYFKNKTAHISFENAFSLEQILNDIVPSETNFIVHGKIPLEISEEIKSLLIEPEKEKKEDQNESMLERYIRLNNESQENSENVDRLLLVIKKQFQNKKVDIKDEIDLTLLPENILKSLIIWDPENDQKQKTNYKYLLDKIENSSLKRDNVLTLLKAKDRINNIPSENWADSISL